MCSIPYGVARPPRFGLARQGSFFKDHAHKNCTRAAAQRSPFEERRCSSYFWGMGGHFAPVFVILSVHTLPTKKQKRAIFLNFYSPGEANA